MNKYDVIIVGTGVAGLFAALNLSTEKKILIITKSAMDQSDSFLAQGGICVQLDDEDYDSFMEDTLRAGHYENKRDAVDVMIHSSREIIDDLIQIGVEFDRTSSGFSYTKEGGHSKPRILHCKDTTGKEINSKLISSVKKLPNVTLLEMSTMIDILAKDNRCYGVVVKKANHELKNYYAQVTILATGGIGGLFAKSTNFPHLTGDALAIALKHKIKLKDIDYIQVHPTSLYTEGSGRSFLISESVRGEGAILIDKNGNRFTDELQTRDILTKKIYEQMKKDQMPYVRLCLKDHVKADIAQRFPAIYEHCLQEGYDITKDCIPVVPAQHYFMGGIEVDLQSKTSMDGLYAVGETSCNGVHGKNRLASNSLLESLVFSKRAAQDIMAHWQTKKHPPFPRPDYVPYETMVKADKKLVLDEIRKEKEHAD
ncbi:MAG TPA: L-aspartate oxidase [Peptococcaceae bacterium]|nr:L-aspartate oxidase [Peptococcaceae bacterium]